MKGRIILDLCGGTGEWSRPYAEAGYHVCIVDPNTGMMEYHHERQRLHTVRVEDFELPSIHEVHGILAAPPCTHFSGSGAQYWRLKDLDGRTAEALATVDACLRIIKHFKPQWWALENPVGRLRKLRRDKLGEPRLIFNPCDYGDAYTKKTLLWGSFQVPVKNPVEPMRVCSQGSWLQRLGGKSDKTKRLRSMTPPGFARAFFEANP